MSLPGISCILADLEEEVHIPVSVGGKDREFLAKIQAWRYGMRFLVDVDGVEVIFERDDEGSFRAVLPEGFTGSGPDRASVEGIVQVLNSL